MGYPRQLIATICEHIDSELIKFFELEKTRLFQEYVDLNDIISATMDEYMETQKTDIHELFSLQTRLRRQKRKRWIDNYQKNLDQYQISDKKNPLNFIYNDFQFSMGAILSKLYDTTDMNTAVSQKIESINYWKDNNSSMLIQFPLLSQKSDDQIRKCYKCDLIINIAHIIIKQFNGNLENYFSQKPELLLNQPFFAASKHSVATVRETNSIFAATLADLEDDDVFIKIYYQSTDGEIIDKLRVFDERDNRILMIILNKIDLNFYNTQSVMVDVGAIAKEISPHPNSKLYADITKRIHRMGMIRYQGFKKSNPTVPIFTLSFFSDVKDIDYEHDSNQKQYINISFGQTLHKSIIDGMISVATNKYNMLELSISKLLYHSLQRERISLFLTTKPDDRGYLVKDYNYTFFQRIILFKTRKKAENIRQLCDGLQDFVDKQIAIADFRCNKSTGSFRIYYFTLTPDEQADFVNTKNISPKDLGVVGISNVADTEGEITEDFFQTSLDLPDFNQ